METEIIIRFPSEKMADYFKGQMSDGFGEGWCNFSVWKQKEGTDGRDNKHYEKIVDEKGRHVCFVSSIELFEDE
jgi:hypothetical protein